MGANLLSMVVPAGQSLPIPGGFMMASINPSEGASFTITNSLPNDIGQWRKTSGSYSTIFTFPYLPYGWNEHTINATGGDVYIEFINGN
jgi:hypothetical protein